MFLGGAAFYALLLGIEALFNRRRPERTALVNLVLRLADVAKQQASGAKDLSAERGRALAAMDAYDALALKKRALAHGPTRDYNRAADISRAADQLLARLLAPDADRTLSSAAAQRLTELASAISNHTPPTPAPAGTLRRVNVLQSAIWDTPATVAGQETSRPQQHLQLSAPGPSLLAASGRLALCLAIAWTTYFFFPIEHRYWIPLTVAIIMKPNLGSVFPRAMLRTMGTLGGAILAVILGQTLPGHIPDAIAMLLLASCLPWAAGRSYAVQTFLLTPLVMLLIHSTSQQLSVVDLTLLRILATLTGAAITIVAGYLIWSSVRHPDFATPFGAALTSLAAYARDVATHASDAEITEARRTAYRHLSDTSTLLQQRLSEPPPAGTEALAWMPVVRSAERVADCLTGASASLVSATAPGSAALEALAAEVNALSKHSQQDRSDRDPTLPPPGIDADQPALQELADEIAALRPMLTRAHRHGHTPAHP